MQPEQVNILIVDDNHGDANLLREAFAENDSRSRLSFSRDGREALTFLRRTVSDDQASQPDLIVLDLKMPGMDGFAFLREFSASPGLRSIPVVVLTGSDADCDKELAIGLGANGYFTKPLKAGGWEGLAAELETIASAMSRSLMNAERDGRKQARD